MSIDDISKTKDKYSVRYKPKADEQMTGKERFKKAVIEALEEEAKKEKKKDE